MATRDQLTRGYREWMSAEALYTRRPNRVTNAARRRAMKEYARLAAHTIRDFPVRATIAVSAGAQTGRLFQARHVLLLEATAWGRPGELLCNARMKRVDQVEDASLAPSCLRCLQRASRLSGAGSVDAQSFAGVGSTA